MLKEATKYVRSRLGIKNKKGRSTNSWGAIGTAGAGAGVGDRPPSLSVDANVWAGDAWWDNENAEWKTWVTEVTDNTGGNNGSFCASGVSTLYPGSWTWAFPGVSPWAQPVSAAWPPQEPEKKKCNFCNNETADFRQLKIGRMTDVVICDMCQLKALNKVLSQGVEYGDSEGAKGDGERGAPSEEGRHPPEEKGEEGKGEV